MAKRLFFDTFHPDTVWLHDKPWTPNMVMEYRGISKYNYRKLREQYSLEDILKNPHICANKMNKRKFVDKSEIFTIGGREWTLAMIYTHWQGVIRNPDTKSYRVFSQRFTSFCHRKKGEHLSRLQLLMMYLESFGASIGRFKNITDAGFESLRKRYVAFISDNRPKKRFYENDKPNLKWYDCARKDPDMYWYLFNLHDEMYKKLSDEFDAYKALVERERGELVRLKIDLSDLREENLRMRDELRNKTSPTWDYIG